MWSQGEVVCRTLSSSQYVSDKVAPGREGTSQVYDELGFGYSLVAAACPGVAACHPQGPAAQASNLAKQQDVHAESLALERQQALDSG